MNENDVNEKLATLCVDTDDEYNNNENMTMHHLVIRLNDTDVSISDTNIDCDEEIEIAIRPNEFFTQSHEKHLDYYTCKEFNKKVKRAKFYENLLLH